MAPHFDLREELQACGHDDYEIENDHEPDGDLAGYLEAAIEQVASNSDAITNPEIFDVYRSVLKHANQVYGQLMTKMLDSICSGLQSDVLAAKGDLEAMGEDAYVEHKTAIEMYAFLLCWFATIAETVKPIEEEAASAPAPKSKRGRGGKSAAASRTAAKKKTSEWSWSAQIDNVLKHIIRVLGPSGIQSQKMWPDAKERDEFINAVTRPAWEVAKIEAHMKDKDVRDHFYKVIELAVTQHGHGPAAQVHVMYSLSNHEHLAERMSELLYMIEKSGNTELTSNVLADISSRHFPTEAKEAKNFQKFLVALSSLVPRTFEKNLALVTSLLEEQAFQVRSAVMDVVGNVITDISTREAEDPEQRNKQLRAHYEKILLERALDVSSFVRVRALGVCRQIVQSEGTKPAFYKTRIWIMSVAGDAIKDTTPSVRRAAVQLINALIEAHPYQGGAHGDELRREDWQAEYDKWTQKLQSMQPTAGQMELNNSQDEEAMQVDEEEEEGAEVGGEEGDEEAGEPSLSMNVDDEEEAPPPRPKKAKKRKPRHSQIDPDAVAAVVNNMTSDEYRHAMLERKHAKDALTFIGQVEEVVEPMGNLLGSKSRPEVLEAIGFFERAKLCGFKCEEGLKKMLHLIWEKDNSTAAPSKENEDGAEAIDAKGIRQRVVKCYQTLYFEGQGSTQKEVVNNTTKNLIELTHDGTLAELTSLEELMRVFMSENLVHDYVISKLWSVYSAQKALPRQQRRGAIIILGMLATARRDVLTDRVDLMLKTGLGHHGKTDLLLARYTCLALQRLNGSAKKVKGSLADNTVRFPVDHPIFRKLQETIERPCRKIDWFGLAEQIINTVYALSEHPDVFCNAVIKTLTMRAFSRRATPGPAAGDGERDENAMDEGQDDFSTPNDGVGEQGDLGDAFELSQLLFVVGHVAIRHIAFMEVVEREWKRQKDEKDANEKKGKKQDSRDTSKEADGLDGVTGNAEDELGDMFLGIRERELLYGEDSLLALYGPILHHVCASPHKYKNKVLRAAATLSLAKFLCVSSQFCDANLTLLLKILETSKNANIRSNIVVALGDVAVSFSHLIDENNNHLYRGLSDDDIVVKKNTLMVLTHLIHNGMIKVKGQIGEIAKLVSDPEPRIADLAKHFFLQISSKDKTIYNNLQDIISHLSTGPRAVDEQTFESTMKYIFTYVNAGERQTDGIVERLCQRFRLTEDPRQWRDIALCLSLISYKGEKSIKRLIESQQLYRDKLHEPVVYERFVAIVKQAKASKAAKNEKNEEELAEFEKILEEHRLQGEEDRELEKRVKGKKRRVSSSTAKARKPPSRKVRMEAVEEEEE
ncbi:non-SMC mitotic condensation complex subunit 1-domain-containing protein [Schizophyllum commune]